jgi:hypothetical protein
VPEIVVHLAWELCISIVWTFVADTLSKKVCDGMGNDLVMRHFSVFLNFLTIPEFRNWPTLASRGSTKRTLRHLAEQINNVKRPFLEVIIITFASQGFP